jgi:adenine deaminase
MDAILPGILKDGRYLSRCMLVKTSFQPGVAQTDTWTARCGLPRFHNEGTGAGVEEAVIEALVMATKNPGEYLAGYHRHHGLPPPACWMRVTAQVITVFDSLRDLRLLHVLSAGKPYLRGGKLLWKAPSGTSTLHAQHTPSEPLKREDFHVAGKRRQAMVRCIDVISESLLTERLWLNFGAGSRDMPEAKGI